MISSLSDRTLYSSLAQSTYMNQASLGLISTPTVNAMHAYLDDIGRHGNMNLSDAEEVELFTPLRQLAAKLMNCSGEQLAIVSSAGEMLSQLPYLFKPANGTKVIAVSSDFPAITRPWIGYAETRDIEIQFVNETMSQGLTETLIDAIDDRTAVLLVSYVQFSTGSMVDCIRLREATQAVGARLVVDVTQAAGAVPIDARQWKPDIMVCSGYKWLGGHGGVGLAVIAPDLLSLTPPSPGWMGAEAPFEMQATQLNLAYGARRYTQSTMSYISIVGLSVAIKQILDLDPTMIRAHASALSARLYHGLRGTGWDPYRSFAAINANTNIDPNASSHIITLAHRDVDADTALHSLLEASIVCSVRNERVRVSVAHFNDETDVEALANTLIAIAEKT